MEISVGYTVAVAAGSVIYVAAFVALSLVTSRALVAGLLYILVWEGALASSFPGIRFLSIRQYALAIADAAGVGGRITGDTLEPATAVLLSAIVVLRRPRAGDPSAQRLRDPASGLGRKTATQDRRVGDSSASRTMGSAMAGAGHHRMPRAAQARAVMVNGSVGSVARHRARSASRRSSSRLAT